MWLAFSSLLQIAEALFEDDQASKQSALAVKVSLQMLLNGTFVPTLPRKTKATTFTNIEASTGARCCIFYKEETPSRGITGDKSMKLSLLS